MRTSAAGVVLYEVLVGRMLYLEDDMQTLLERVRRAEIAPLMSPVEIARAEAQAEAWRPAE